jgi:Tfp pilus assembly protein PilN
MLRGVITQQVNLFQPIFRKEHKLLSFRVLLQACAAVLLVLLLMYGWGLRQTEQMNTELGRLKERQIQFTQQLGEVSSRLAVMKTDSREQQLLSELEREWVARRKVVAVLMRVRDSYSQGISTYLESFSRQTPNGVWLTNFSVKAGGEGLVVRGSALKPELVPTFLHQLAAEKALAGTKFGLLHIQREDTAAHHVDFIVYTGAIVPEESRLLEPES